MQKYAHRTRRSLLANSDQVIHPGLDDLIGRANMCGGDRSRGALGLRIEVFTNRMPLGDLSFGERRGSPLSGGQSNPILMYHGVSPERGRRFRKFVVPPSRFEEQMAHLAARGFAVCSVSDLVAARTRGAGDGQRLVGLTFDDAFSELSKYAIPVLQRLGFGATVYVPTAYIGASSGWLARIGEGHRPLLDADHLRELSATGFECGSHSHTHAALDVLPREAARMEIERSKRLLEDTIGREVRTFGYPFGYENAAVRRLVGAAGYASACRVHYRMSPAGEDVFGLSRLAIDGDCSLNRFTDLVAGRSALRRERALAAVWRPLRRGIGAYRRSAGRLR